MKRIASPVVILGGKSDIGIALARVYAEAGCPLVLAARRCERLATDRDDLQARFNVPVNLAEFDVTSDNADAFFRALSEPPGTVVLVAGFLGDQKIAQFEDREAVRILTTNFTGAARWLLAASRVMKRTPGSTIIGFSSVAGDRGRSSNFVYGSAKAGLSAFLSGLRGSLLPQGIHVMTVKLGFAETKMTAGMNLPKLLTAKPKEVARAVVRAQRRSVDVLYVRSIWRPIMMLIRAIPERVFKRLQL